jgi:hypothetical protein
MIPWVTKSLEIISGFGDRSSMLRQIRNTQDHEQESMENSKYENNWRDVLRRTPDNDLPIP